MLQFFKRHGVEHICGYPPDPGVRGHWTVEDLERTPDGSATVLIRRSKTDPEGTGVPLYLAPDTMAYLEAWLTAAGLSTGLVFRALTREPLLLEQVLAANALPRSDQPAARLRLDRALKAAAHKR